MCASDGHSTVQHAVYISTVRSINILNNYKFTSIYCNWGFSPVTRIINHMEIQGGSNMTGTDLYVNKPHCAAAVRPWESEAQPPLSLLLGLEPVQSCLGVARVMSEQKVPRSVEQRIVIKFLVGENVPRNLITMRFSTLRGTFFSLITLATPRQDWTGSNPSRREGGGCGFTLSRSHSCCAVRLVYTQISPGRIWTTLYITHGIKRHIDGGFNNICT